MQQIWTVLWQEYLLKVRTRGFLIGTFLFPLLIAGTGALPMLLMRVGVKPVGAIAVADASGRLGDAFVRALADTSAARRVTRAEGSSRRNASDGRLETVLIPFANRTHDQVVADLSAQVDQEQIGGFLLFGEDAVETGRSEFYARNVSDFVRNQRLEDAFTRAVRQVRIASSNFDAAQIEPILRDTRLDTYKVAEGGLAKADRGNTFLLAYIVGMSLYISLFVYGAMLLRVVLEEKTSRSAEVMVSIVRPERLLTGKILSVALLAATQIGAWIAVVGLVSAMNPGFAVGGAQFGNIAAQMGLTPGLVTGLVAFFLLGFLFYAACFGAIGAMVPSEAEAQQAQAPITIPIVIALMLMFLAIRDPNGVVIRIASFVPFFAPILMPVRMCVVMPPIWETILVFLTLLGSTFAAFWVAGRIFRVGILMHGKRPNLPELLKWVKAR